MLITRKQMIMHNLNESRSWLRAPERGHGTGTSGIARRYLEIARQLMAEAPASTRRRWKSGN